MGVSGVGKTTVLQLMTGHLRAAEGQVLVDDQDIGRMSARALRRLRLRMGFLFQQSALFTDLTVFDNVAFALREHTGLPESLIRILVLMKLQSVGLRGVAELMPAELSGGMARRVALARAIAMDPDILFCDEPFSGLDPVSIGVVVRLLRQMNEALGITVILVSHDVPEVEVLAHRCFMLAEGGVAAAGTFAELKRSSSGIVQQFMNGTVDGPIPFHVPAVEYFDQLLRR